MIILEKSFHHDNLKLQLIHDVDLQIFTINIHRQNTNTNYDIFGIFTTLSQAEIKFHSIKL
jgi:hypothetical protein